MTTTLLIDSDIVAFKFSSASQQDFDWGGGIKSRFVRNFEAVAGDAKDYVNGLKLRLKADDVIICLSVPSSEGWRKQILPTYKSHRDGVERPEHLQSVKDYLAKEFPSYIRPTLEADDVMGILSTHPTLVPGKKIIVSEDKDMKTIPGWLFNPAKDKKPRLVTEEEADYFHMFQTLVGDPTDGYKGCPGVGPKKAAKVLLDGEDQGSILSPKEMWDGVFAKFSEKGLTREDALTQARVARICRHTDYDFKKKEVILWSPPR